MSRLFFLSLCFTLCSAASAADLARANELLAQGEEILIAANSNRELVVDAALTLTKAREEFAAAEEWETVSELNAYIYWCRKRMTNDDIDRYLAAKTDSATESNSDFDKDEMISLLGVVDEVAHAEVDASEADDYLARANAFAAANPDKPFQAHLRFLEVAERFGSSNTKVAVAAMRSSSDALDAFAQSIETSGRIPPSVFQAPITTAKTGRQPIPDAAAQGAAARDIKKHYREQLRERDPQKLRKTAAWLLEEAHKSSDQPAVAYVLATMAADMSVERDVMALMTTLQAADFIHSNFIDVDVIELKSEYLKQARGYPPAEAIITLLTNPDDKRANEQAGKFLCFVEGNWKDGLPMMAATGDQHLTKLAQMEIAGPKGPAQQRELADAWYEMADDENNFETGMYRRALHWYQKALTKIEGLSKQQVTERITEISDNLPVDLDSLDYATLTEAQWHKIDGRIVTCNAKWLITDTGVKIGANQQVRIIPHPTDEWGFEIAYKNVQRCNWQGLDGRGGTGSMRVQLSRKGGRSFRITEVVSGPGQIVLRAIHPYYLRQGLGKIRCKIVPVE